ncbi:MAG: hypothetical protein A3G81_11825 [Betaproteobacteria bacterium RIFCSPLOWO2_12_FULL_65_14]|nr:MAG: hypothetical protein A3G81_11825 [Betaproteobacteria bacterium RIFCSPLOWO2_12_FULL_65_14]
MASRYHRQALPDELVERLRPVKFEKAGKSGIHGIIGFWLDYDPNDNSLPPDQKYELAVNVVYATDDVAHEKAAVEAARALRAAFEAQFKKDGKWKSIELVRCEAVSERDFTMRDMRETVNFRLEHLSLRAGPDAPMSPE